MKIEILGSAAGLAKSGFCTSVFITEGNSHYIIDFGAPVEKLLQEKNIKLDNIKAAFVTHMHADHAETLVSCAKYYAKFYEQFNNTAEVELFMPDGINEYLSWINALNMPMSDRMHIHKMNEGLVYEDGTITVTAVRTEHLGKDVPSYALYVKSKDKTVLFTGDLTEDLHDMPCCDGVDLLVCEYAHSEADTLCEKISSLPVKNVLFYHGGVSGRKAIEAVKNKEFNCNFAYDGYQTEV